MTANPSKGCQGNALLRFPARSFDDELEAARSYNEVAKKHGRNRLNVLPTTA
jgi:hypothetical protein